VGVGDADPVHREHGIAAVEEEAVLGDVGPLPALAAEPALVGHPLAEQVGEHLHRESPSASGSGALSPGVSSAALTTPAASSESATELEVACSQSSCSSGATSVGLASSNQ